MICYHDKQWALDGSMKPSDHSWMNIPNICPVIYNVERCLSQE